MDVFRQVFQLHERRNRREAFPCMLVMYTIVAHSRELSDQEMFQVMASLKRSCMLSLRKCDVITQHSNTQLLLLLPSASELNISVILMRIQSKFSQLCLESGVNLTTQVRSIQQRQAVPNWSFAATNEYITFNVCLLGSEDSVLINESLQIAKQTGSCHKKELQLFTARCPD